jgi:uncharacterized damage-inducible protein DinB
MTLTNDPIAHTIALLDAERENLLAAVQRVPEHERDRRPAEMRWSIAEVLEHLATVERGIAALIAKRGRYQPRPDEPIPVPLDDERIARLRNRGERMEAPDFAKPSGTVVAAEALRTLVEGRAALRRALVDADPASLEKCTSTHPALGTLSLRDWAQFVAHHEARHTSQVLEIADALSR